MSSAVIPLPKPAGARPPIGPPSRTTFDARPDDSGEPIHRRISDSVTVLLNACKDVNEGTAPLFRRLIAQRKKVVQRELDMLRMFATKPMPPLMSNFYSLDFLASDGPSAEVDVERLYVRLLSDLDAADERLARIIRERNG